MGSVWATITSYSATVVPRESLATLQGILHGVYWGLGAGSGYMIGGQLIKNYGAVLTFRGFSAMSIVACVLFILAQKVRPKSVTSQPVLTAPSSGNCLNGTTCCDL